MSDPRERLCHVRLASMPWGPGAHELERRKADPASGTALLEFAPGFQDPGWCERSHVIYVLAGALELELRDGTRRIDAGEAARVDAGTAHRARNPGAVPTVLFVVSDVGPAPGAPG